MSSYNRWVCLPTILLTLGVDRMQVQPSALSAMLEPSTESSGRNPAAGFDKDLETAEARVAADLSVADPPPKEPSPPPIEGQGEGIEIDEPNAPIQKTDPISKES